MAGPSSRAKPPGDVLLSRSERALIAFLNAPFFLVVPPLFAIIVGMVYAFSVATSGLYPGYHR